MGSIRLPVQRSAATSKTTFAGLQAVLKTRVHYLALIQAVPPADVRYEDVADCKPGCEGPSVKGVRNGQRSFIRSKPRNRL